MTRRRLQLRVGALGSALALAVIGAAGVATARVIDRSATASRPAAARAAGALIELVTTPLQRGTRAQIAASAVGVRQCSLSFAGPAGLAAGPYGVELHLRQVQWTWMVPQNARAGRWTASVACKGAITTTANLQLRAATPGTQPIVAPGSLVVVPLSLANDYDGGKGGGTSSCAPGKLDPKSGYCTGYCTEFVWSLRPDLSGLGDATRWYAEKSSLKGPVPAVHAVAWWRAKAPGRPFGHVAYVTGMGAGTITVREMNHGRGHWNVADTRTIALGTEDAPTGYIYEGAPPPTLTLPQPRNTVTVSRTTTTAGPVMTVTQPAVTVTTTTATTAPTTTAPPLHDSTTGTSTTATAPIVSESVGATPIDTFLAAGTGTPSGAQIAPGHSVDVVCEVTVAQPAGSDPASVAWYLLHSAPWDDVYYARADGFLNGASSGSTSPPPVDPKVPICPAPPTDTTDTTDTTETTVATSPPGVAWGGGPVAPIISPTITPIAKIIKGKAKARLISLRLIRPREGHAYVLIKVMSASKTAHVTLRLRDSTGKTVSELSKTFAANQAVKISSSSITPDVKKISVFSVGDGSGPDGSGPPSPRRTSDIAGPFGAPTYRNVGSLSGSGPSLRPYQSVWIRCKTLERSNRSGWLGGVHYWYVVADAPWRNAYEAPAEAFLNGDSPNGPFRTQVLARVPSC